jgi:hypothetical protein
LDLVARPEAKRKPAKAGTQSARPLQPAVPLGNRIRHCPSQLGLVHDGLSDIFRKCYDVGYFPFEFPDLTLTLQILRKDIELIYVASFKLHP